MMMENQNKASPFPNALMNQAKENYGNNSNDTAPDANQIGHILTREQIEDLERQAIQLAD
jgi:hypothetical protein